jgi:GAF domain-containing protein
MLTQARLELLYELNRRLTRFSDLEALIGYATRRCRELLQADGCGLLLLTESRDEFWFPFASQSERTAETNVALRDIRFPADRGIAGWVLVQDEPALVLDADSDERLYRGVDKKTGLQTKSLLCAPLRTPTGTIGVIEVLNPMGNQPTREDLEFLEAIANDVAIAHMRVHVIDALERENKALREENARLREKLAEGGT